MYERNIVGSKYEEVKGMDIKDIAKLIRADLKRELPELKTSVRIERYSMGRSCNVHVTMDKYPTHEEQDPIRTTIRKITDQYNYDNSDPMTDYFNVSFYSNVSFHTKETK
jgi:hypothetical protein